MAVLNLIRLLWWRVFPYISLTYSLCRWNHSLTALFLDGILFISGRAADLTCASSRPLSDIDRVKGLDAWRECERYVRLIWIHMDLWSTLGPMIWTLVEQNPQSSKVSAKRIGCLDFPVGKSPGFLPLWSCQLERPRYKQLLRRAWKGRYQGNETGWDCEWGVPDQVGPLIPS